MWNPPAAEAVSPAAVAEAAEAASPAEAVAEATASDQDYRFLNSGS